MVLFYIYNTKMNTMKNIFLIFSITLTLTVMQTKAQWSEVGGLNALGANGGVGSIVFDASGNFSR